MAEAPPQGRRWTRREMGVIVLAAAAGTLALPLAAEAAETGGQLGSAGSGGSAMPLLATTNPTLRMGSHGSAVTRLQRRLAELHYDVGAVDGSFGSQTFHGVVAFQKVNGLSRDGIVGPRTWAALANPVVPRPRRKLWRPNYFFRGFAVHGSSSVPAFPASHGCVRVTIQAMNRLWPLLRIGMPVSLYR
jgi:hypothetical protein